MNNKNAIKGNANQMDNDDELADPCFTAAFLRHVRNLEDTEPYKKWIIIAFWLISFVLLFQSFSFSQSLSFSIDEFRSAILDMSFGSMVS